MEKNYLMKVDVPDTEEKEERIAQIIAQSVREPQRLGSALWSLWSAVGFRGICFGVWDCMLLAFLLDGILWAAVYQTAGKNPHLLSLLLFLMSPVLYAMLHLLTVWKERMAGMYQTLMVCKMSLRQMTVLRLILFGGISVIFLSSIHVWAAGAGENLSVLRMLSLSVSALFFYAWIQLLLEWKWQNRYAYGAAPAMWGGCGFVLLSGGWELQILDRIPTAALLLCAVFCASIYFASLKQYYFEPCTM